VQDYILSTAGDALTPKRLGVVNTEAIIYDNSTEIPYSHTGKENCPPLCII